MEVRISESPFGGRVIAEREFSGLHLADGVYPAKSIVPSHSHERAVFCIALKGVCSEIYGGRRRDYEAFSIEFLPPNQSHSLNFPYADTRAFSIDVATSWLERAREFSLRIESSAYCSGGLLSGLMIKAYREFRQMDGASQLAIEGLLLEMLVEVSRHQVKILDRKPPRWLAQALELLNDGFSERVTLTQLASAVGVHPVHLAREFRRFQRCSIGEYVRRLRIERACGQLHASNESLAAIASANGFADQSHFSRTFKRLRGMTPTEYRAVVGRR
jgi:AraC family transcriptional regulator